jgi:spoIIIJ-associated protein
MEWVETTGKTLDEAKEAALDQLGVDASDAEFVLISEPKAGLFGRMRGEARVRARVRPTAPRPKRGRARRDGREGGTRRAESKGARTGRGGGATKQGGRGGVSVADAGPGTDVAPDDGAIDSAGSPETANGRAPAGAGAAGGSGTGTTRKRRRRGGRGRSRGPRAGAGSDSTTGAVDGVMRGGEDGASANGSGRAAMGKHPVGEGNEEETVEQVLSLEEQGESARRFVEGVVREMGLVADVSVRLVDEETAEVSVGGDELGLLIGPGGATLSALQEVTRTVVQGHNAGHTDRIIVDVAGYRARRAEALARFATQMVDEVKSTGEERALESMNPSDRKVVHDTVNAIGGVQTRSEGEEPRRYVVISLASVSGQQGVGDDESESPDPGTAAVEAGS